MGIGLILSTILLATRYGIQFSAALQLVTIRRQSTPS